MEINTCSAAISFARELEEDSAKLYEYLSQSYPKDAEVLSSFAAENKKNVVQVQRAYYGVISDAIEGCFAFNINPDDYALEIEISEKTGYTEALEKAIEMENRIIKFYSDAAEQSKSLMADVPRAFTLVAKKRSSRIAKLESLK